MSSITTRGKMEREKQNARECEQEREREGEKERESTHRPEPLRELMQTLDGLGLQARIFPQTPCKQAREGERETETTRDREGHRLRQAKHWENNRDLIDKSAF